MILGSDEPAPAHPTTDRFSGLADVPEPSSRCPLSPGERVRVRAGSPPFTIPATDGFNGPADVPEPSSRCPLSSGGRVRVGAGLLAISPSKTRQTSVNFKS